MRSFITSIQCILVSVWFVAATETIAADDSANQVWPLTNTRGLKPNQVTVAAVKFKGRPAVRVRMIDDFSGGDSNTLALLAGTDFGDGVIEVDVASRVDPNAWFFFRWFARGFVGIAF